MPPASPVPSAISPLRPAWGGSRDQAVDTLARTLWGEARGEPAGGLAAVAHTVVNRALLGAAQRKYRWWGSSIVEVCRKPQQYSCWNDDDPNCAKLKQVTAADADFRRCLAVAAQAVDGTLGADPTGGATHYHTRACHPSWAKGKAPCYALGDHLFYRPEQVDG